MPSWICIEYRCPRGHVAASLEDRGHVRDHRPCECGELGRRAISAPRIKVPIVGVTTTGRSVSERPPGVPDTSLLADGMDPKEWRSRYTSQRERDHELEREVRRVRNLPDSRKHEL